MLIPQGESSDDEGSMNVQVRTPDFYEHRRLNRLLVLGDS